MATPFRFTELSVCTLKVTAVDGAPTSAVAFARTMPQPVDS